MLYEHNEIRGVIRVMFLGKNINTNIYVYWASWMYMEEIFKTYFCFTLLYLSQSACTNCAEVFSFYPSGWRHSSQLGILEFAVSFSLFLLSGVSLFNLQLKLASLSCHCIGDA